MIPAHARPRIHRGDHIARTQALGLKRSSNALLSLAASNEFANNNVLS